MNTFDVTVVGAGVIGCAIACELSRRDFRVLVIDRQEPGREASWAAAGMLSAAPHPADSPGLLPLAKASYDFVSRVRFVDREFIWNCNLLPPGRRASFIFRGSS